MTPLFLHTAGLFELMAKVEKIKLLLGYKDLEELRNDLKEIEELAYNAGNKISKKLHELEPEIY